MCNCNKPNNSIKREPLKQGSTKTSAVNPTLMKRRSFATAAIETGAELNELPGKTIEEKCLTFGYMLGLDTAVPERVLIAALSDAGYGRRLLSSRDNQVKLYDMLNNPPFSNAAKSQFSNGKLVSKAGKAFVRWALSGFPTVSKEVLKRREDACLSCPNLTEPTSMLQRFTAPAETGISIGSRTGNAACASCGCVVRNKIRLATESCPEHIAGDENVNRWGEAIR